MGKSTKRRNIKRRKTRRRKVKGGRATKAMLYVWQNPDETLNKRIFVKQGMDYGDSATDAGYQMRFFDNGFDNTIPRKDGKEIKPYVKYMTADYSAAKDKAAEAKAEEVAKAEAEKKGKTKGEEGAAGGGGR